jgi:hypothetical protein
LSEEARGDLKSGSAGEREMIFCAGGWGTIIIISAVNKDAAFMARCNHESTAAASATLKRAA